MQYVQVEGHADLVRDPITKAIINRSTSDYSRNKQARENLIREKALAQEQQQKIEDLQAELRDIKKLVLDILESKK